VDVDDAYIDRAPLEGRPLQDLHDGPDRVAFAEIVVEPQLIHPFVAVSLENGDSRSARPGYRTAMLPTTAGVAWAQAKPAVARHAHLALRGGVVGVLAD
jgi:hypothetical protein